MPIRTATGPGFTLSVRYPSAGWDFAPSVVPALRSPHELCALSNRPLRPLPVVGEENTPDVSGLGISGFLIWVYYEVQNDPLINDQGRPPVPDYSRYSYPLVYSEAQFFPARDYSWGADLSWRRLGHNLPPALTRPDAVAVTVMTWQGSRVPAGDLRAAEAIVASVSITQSNVTN